MTASGGIAGRVAVVTGGASGIGRGIAEALISAGARVVIADIEDGPLQKTAEEIGASAYRTDVSKIADVEALARYTLELHGRVDILCNNAGVGHLAPFDELTVDDFAWVVDVNLGGVINGMTTFLPIMRETTDDGWVVNTASLAGLVASPGMAAYAASKFAVVALTEVVAQELARSSARIGASVLVPGLVDTAIGDSERNRPSGSRHAPPQLDQIPPGRMLTSAEVGQTVVDGILRGDLYIVTHPEALPAIQDRHHRIEAAFRAAADRQPST